MLLIAGLTDSKPRSANTSKQAVIISSGTNILVGTGMKTVLTTSLLGNTGSSTASGILLLSINTENDLLSDASRRVTSTYVAALKATGRLSTTGLTDTKIINSIRRNLRLGRNEYSSRLEARREYTTFVQPIMYGPNVHASSRACGSWRQLLV